LGTRENCLKQLNPRFGVDFFIQKFIPLSLTQIHQQQRAKAPRRHMVIRPLRYKAKLTRSERKMLFLNHQRQLTVKHQQLSSKSLCTSQGMPSPPILMTLILAFPTAPKMRDCQICGRSATTLAIDVFIPFHLCILPTFLLRETKGLS
jgi:hypothetical protein